MMFPSFLKPSAWFGMLLLVFTPVAALAEWGDWHAPEVFILRTGPHEVYLAQMGPDPTQGVRSEMQCQAIAFYKNEKAIKSYSRYDIVKAVPGLDAPPTHYEILGQAHGFRRSEGGRLVFEVESYKGDVLVFDAETGEMIQK